MPTATGNALYESAKWETDANVGPPPAWDGTSYNFADVNGDTWLYCDHYDAASGEWPSNILEGRTVEFDLEVLVAMPGVTFGVFFNDFTTPVTTLDMSSTGIQHYASDPLAADTSVYLALIGTNPGGSIFKLTPTGTVPDDSGDGGGGDTGGCFWTDLVGCLEDCSDTPTPPVDPGVFNLATWNLPYQIGCCTSADDSCVQTDGLTDSFGDVPTMAEPLSVPGGSSLSPTMGDLGLVVPVRCLPRTPVPGCVDSLPVPRLRVTIALTPPPGGVGGMDWDLIGAFNTVPFIDVNAGIFNSPDGSGSPVVTGAKYGDTQIDTSGASWKLTALVDADLTSGSMPNTEDASVVMTFSYTGSDSSGTPVVIESITLDVEATCPC